MVESLRLSERQTRLGGPDWADIDVCFTFFRDSVVIRIDPPLNL